MKENEITGKIIDCAMRVHSSLGPGLLESAYETCLMHLLRKEGLQVRTQVSLPIEFEGVKLDAGYRIDLIVEETVIVELKTVERFEPIHTAQLLSYLKLSHNCVGLLLNFHVVHMREGIKRIVNDFRPSASSASSAVGP
jgi:GxxExxY protein